ncbi:hypothetical protein [Nocardia sp. NPDC003963]
MRARPIDRPADLDTVRESYDKVADNYAEMVVTTGIGDIRSYPWHEASIGVFADKVRESGPCSTSAAAPAQ